MSVAHCAVWSGSHSAQCPLVIAPYACYRSKLLSIIPFTKPAPSRRIALAWRKSFARTQAVEALAQAKTGIHHLE